MLSRRFKYVAMAAALSVILCTGCSLFHKKDASPSAIDTEKTEDEVIASGGGNGSTEQGTAVQKTTDAAGRTVRTIAVLGSGGKDETE